MVMESRCSPRARTKGVGGDKRREERKRTTWEKETRSGWFWEEEEEEGRFENVIFLLDAE